MQLGSGSSVGAAAKGYSTALGRVPRADLLTVEETRPFLVLGFDVRRQPMLDPTLFDITTVGGPCGAQAPTPFSPAKGFVVYRSTDTLTIETIADPGEIVATAFVDRLAADARNGCPDYAETLGGQPRTVHYDQPLDLGGLGSRRIGYAQRLSGSTYPRRFVMVVAGGGRVTMLVVFSNDRLVPENLNPLLKQAVTGLR